MRGALRRGKSRAARIRIIPADAGSTEFIGDKTRQVRDHPRGCGEHGTISAVIPLLQGSSQRMRGAQTSVVDGVMVIGIIPADAGSTLVSGRYMSERKDHPRGCGEHPARIRIQSTRLGSSPRMRGARPSCWSPTSSSRIIPADAGSTQRGWQ